MNLKRFAVHVIGNSNKDNKLVKVIESDSLIGAIIQLNKSNKICYRINDNSYVVKDYGAIVISEYKCLRGAENE